MPRCPQALMFGIVYAANMFGAGLEVILKNDLFANPIIAFVIVAPRHLCGLSLMKRKPQALHSRPTAVPMRYPSWPI